MKRLTLNQREWDGVHRLLVFEVRLGGKGRVYLNLCFLPVSWVILATCTITTKLCSGAGVSRSLHTPPGTVQETGAVQVAWLHCEGSSRWGSDRGIPHAAKSAEVYVLSRVLQ